MSNFEENDETQNYQFCAGEQYLEENDQELKGLSNEEIDTKNQFDEFERRIKKNNNKINDSSYSSADEKNKIKSTINKLPSSKKKVSNNHMYQGKNSDANKQFPLNFGDSEDDDMVNPIYEKKQSQPINKDKQILDEILKQDPKSKETFLKKILQDNNKLIIDIQKEKSQISSLEIQIKKKNENQNNLIKKKIPEEKQPTTKNTKAELENKIGQCEIRLHEEQEKLGNLKVELNKIIDVLKSECGPFSSIDELLKNEISWKQKQQTIENLKTQLKKYAVGLKSSGQNTTNSSREILNMAKIKNDAKNQELKMQLEKENERLLEDCHKLMQNVENYEAKQKVYDHEMAEMKKEWDTKVEECVAFSNESEQTINDLSEQMSQLKFESYKLKKMDPQNLPAPNKVDLNQIDSLHVMQLTEKLNHLRSVAKEKEKQVINLYKLDQNIPKSPKQFFLTKPSAENINDEIDTEIQNIITEKEQIILYIMNKKDDQKQRDFKINAIEEIRQQLNTITKAKKKMLLTKIEKEL